MHRILRMLIKPSQVQTFQPTFTRRFFASTTSEALSLDYKVTKAKEWFDQGTAKWNNNDIAGAKIAYERSAALHPTSDNYYNLGNCLYSLGEPQEAVKSWEQCIKLSPNQVDAHVNLANVYALSINKPETAVKHYEIAMKINPEDGEVAYNYGVVLDSMGKLEEAVKLYEVALKAGVDVAEKNLRNAKAKILGKKLECLQTQTE